MTTKSIARAAAAIAATAFGLAGAVAPAQAADEAPLTYAQLQVDPTMVAVQSQVTSLLAGDFSMGGRQYAADGAVTSELALVHRGGASRVWIRRDGVAAVGISTETQSCVRVVTRAAPNSYAGDLRSRWDCRKDANGTLAPHPEIVTPFGVAELFDSASGGTGQYTVTPLPGGGLHVDFSAEGEQPGAFEFATPADGPSTFTLTLGSGAEAYQVVAYTTTPGATWRIPAVAKLKR